MMHQVYMQSSAQTQRAYPGLDSIRKEHDGNNDLEELMEFSELSRRTSDLPTVAYNHDLVHSTFSNLGAGR